LRHVPARLSRRVPARRAADPDPRLRRACLRASAEPHVSRSHGGARGVPSRTTHLDGGDHLMIKIANTQFWVHDQDEALAFYTRTLGWEVRADVTMEEWNFRWLVVGPMDQV